ncbi:hypothetical protein [Mycolicibacterium gilvum]|uniref:hypothetical protein n=1 Tax=Mycolicibacterium gilvum TaxID=1804 RepID=UPI00031014C0|nr:hypothetical protein [Mycolicibacterium gilvum]
MTDEADARATRSRSGLGSVAALLWHCPKSRRGRLFALREGAVAAPSHRADVH